MFAAQCAGDSVVPEDDRCYVERMMDDWLDHDYESVGMRRERPEPGRGKPKPAAHHRYAANETELARSGGKASVAGGGELPFKESALTKLFASTVDTLVNPNPTTITELTPLAPHVLLRSWDTAGVPQMEFTLTNASQASKLGPLGGSTRESPARARARSRLASSPH